MKPGVAQAHPGVASVGHADDHASGTLGSRRRRCSRAPVRARPGRRPWPCRARPRRCNGIAPGTSWRQRPCCCVIAGGLRHGIALGEEPRRHKRSAVLFDFRRQLEQELLSVRNLEFLAQHTGGLPPSSSEFDRASRFRGRLPFAQACRRPSKSSSRRNGRVCRVRPDRGRPTSAPPGLRPARSRRGQSIQPGNKRTAAKTLGADTGISWDSLRGKRDGYGNAVKAGRRRRRGTSAVAAKTSILCSAHACVNRSREGIVVQFGLKFLNIVKEKEGGHPAAVTPELEVVVLA